MEEDIIYIGIDCGKNTGVAVYNQTQKKLSLVTSLPIHKALDLIKEYSNKKIKLFIENPNTFVPFGTSDRGRLQGAGSIKRDYTIWKDFCEDNNIDYKGTRLQGTLKKITSNRFKELTGWEGRTNEHSRDAALLVYNKKTV